MNDLDFRAPQQRPAPERLRDDIDLRLRRAARHRQRARWLVAAVLVLVLIGGAAFVAARLDRRPAPAAGLLGTLDVGPVSPAEADSQLASCLADADPEIRALTGWTVRYARFQHLDGRDPARVTAVLWAQSGDTLLGCTDGANPSSFSPAPAPGPLTGPDAAGVVVQEAVPTPSCRNEPPADPAVALLHVAPTVRSARVRLVVDGRPRSWQTTGVEGGLASVPVLDPDDFTTLSNARSLSYQLQTLDEDNAMVPIATLASGPVPTYLKEIATCADEAGVVEHPASAAAGEAECLRLVAAAAGQQDDTRTVRVAFRGPARFIAVVGTAEDQSLCSLEPTRGVRSIGSPTTTEPHSAASVDRSPLTFSAVDRGNRGVVVWAGGKLGPDVAAIAYTFPDGHTVPATLDHGFWALSYVTDRPFLNGRPLDQLPPAEVVVTSTDGSRTRSSITFPDTNDCDPDLVLPSC